MKPDPTKNYINNVGDYEVPVKSKNWIDQTVSNLLFLPALANLEWSRGYLWYVELDDVPHPFQRGGVLGLPVTDITYELCNTETYKWNGGIESFSVPSGKGQSTLNMTMYDDEQATLFTFFERWYNNIYNSRAGILPVVEAAKCLSIYKLKASRTPVKRNAYRYNLSNQSTSINSETTTRIETPSRELLVYPTGTLQEKESYTSNPRTYTIDMVIVNQENPDYGNPSEATGTSYAYDKDKQQWKSTISDGSTFLDKVADYF